jgi:hypothetical protein
MFSWKYPPTAIALGLAELPNGQILIQSQRLADFLGLRPNSLRKNLRDHGFHRDENQQLSEILQEYYPHLAREKQSWAVWHNEIGEYSHEADMDFLEKLTSQAQQARKPMSPPSEVIPNIWDTLFDYFDSG